MMVVMMLEMRLKMLVDVIVLLWNWVGIILER